MYTYEQIIRAHYFGRPKNIQDGEKQVRRWGSTHGSNRQSKSNYIRTHYIGRHNEAMRQSFPCGPKIMCINQAMIQERSRYVRTYDIRRPSELVSLRKTLRKTQVHSRWGKASMMLRTNTWTKPSEQVQQYTYTLYWRHKTTQNWEIRKKFFVWPKNNVH